MKTAIVLLAHGFEEVEAVTPLDFLRRAGIEVVSAGIGGRTIQGAHGIEVTADIEIKQAGTDYDAVVIPGGMPGAANINASKDADSLIRGLYKKGRLVAAICAAPAVVLAAKGLLSGKKATCYPGFEKDLQASGAAFVADRVVKDGNIITSRAPGTAAEFALAIIGFLEGAEAAGKIFDGTLQKR